MNSASTKMRSPRLKSTSFRVVRSPCSMMTSTPISDSRMPAACASVSRAPTSTSDHIATNSGKAGCNSSVLIACVCSSDQYCMVLKAPMPVTDNRIMMPSLPRMAAQSRTRCFQANGRMIRKASDQRRNDSVTGAICPAASLPTTALPAQHAAVMESSR